MMNLTQTRPKDSVHTAKSKATAITWTTELVNRWTKEEERGLEHTLPAPYEVGKIGVRKPGLRFVHTPAEKEEYIKCAKDIVYFVENYCVTMTDYGIELITLRPYQRRILKEFQKFRFNVFVASRQVGKTTTAGFFMTWYSTFHKDRNCLVVGNKLFTAKEILNKTSISYRGLPFFLKPGAFTNNKESLEFDNGCRIFANATTETPGLGFTIHLLYCDEFAHVPRNIVGPFWRSIWPTLSSSLISRCIVTSTFNGMNKFYNMYDLAMKGDSPFNPIRVDWWEVPGHDEEWKKMQMAGFDGSEDEFNQEFGNIPISSKLMLLPSTVLQVLERFKKEFEWRELIPLEDAGIDYTELKWDPKFNDFDFDPVVDKFVLSIDTAEGIGKDYSVINIFKLMPFSVSKIKRATKYSNENDFFRLVQVGLFRSNKMGMEELSKLLSYLVYFVLSADACNIVIEMNRAEGMMIHQKLKSYEDYYWDDLILHTKHSLTAVKLSPGVKLNEQNKILFCRELKVGMMAGRVLLQEKNSVFEAKSFGINRRGRYSGLGGNDDIMMSTVNLSPYFTSGTFNEMAGELFDNMDPIYQVAIDEKLRDFPVERNSNEGVDYNILNEL